MPELILATAPHDDPARHLPVVCLGRRATVDPQCMRTSVTKRSRARLVAMIGDRLEQAGVCQRGSEADAERLAEDEDTAI